MTDHQRRYEDQVRAYVRTRGEDPDRNWRAFLWCATVRPGIWEKAESFVNFARATVDFDSMGAGYWPSGERLIMTLARALYNNEGDVDVTALASMDDDLWAAVMMAFELYRGRKSPRPV
jgi:hypothetical protein